MHTKLYETNLGRNLWKSGVPGLCSCICMQILWRTYCRVFYFTNWMKKIFGFFKIQFVGKNEEFLVPARRDAEFLDLDLNCIKWDSSLNVSIWCPKTLLRRVWCQACPIFTFLLLMESWKPRLSIWICLGFSRHQQKKYFRLSLFWLGRNPDSLFLLRKIEEVLNLKFQFVKKKNALG